MSGPGSAPIDHAWIAAHVPHAGRMCLLESVQRWDQRSIECRAVSHRAADHPLRSRGRLGAACLIEYAAQAIAVHAALLCGPHTVPYRPGKGMIASARSVDLLVPRIDDCIADLALHARREHADARGALYDFEVCADAAVLARGRMSVVLGTALRTPA